jgi:hypothetical protein
MSRKSPGAKRQRRMRAADLPLPRRIDGEDRREEVDDVIAWLPLTDSRAKECRRHLIELTDDLTAVMSAKPSGLTPRDRLQIMSAVAEGLSMVGMALDRSSADPAISRDLSAMLADKLDLDFIARVCPDAGVPMLGDLLSERDLSSRSARMRGGPLRYASGVALSVKRSALSRRGSGTATAAVLFTALIAAAGQAQVYYRSLVPRGGPHAFIVRSQLIRGLAMYWWRELGREPEGGNSNFVAFVEGYADLIGWPTGPIKRAVEKVLSQMRAEGAFP